MLTSQHSHTNVEVRHAPVTTAAGRQPSPSATVTIIGHDTSKARFPVHVCNATHTTQGLCVGSETIDTNSIVDLRNCDSCVYSRPVTREGSGGSYEPPPTRSPGPLYDMEATLATHISCRRSDDSQRSSQAVQQDRVPQCSRLAPHCMHDTCYIMRVQKNC